MAAGDYIKYLKDKKSKEILSDVFDPLDTFNQKMNEKMDHGVIISKDPEWGLRSFTGKEPSEKFVPLSSQEKEGQGSGPTSPSGERYREMLIKRSKMQKSLSGVTPISKSEEESQVRKLKLK